MQFYYSKVCTMFLKVKVRILPESLMSVGGRQKKVYGCFGEWRRSEGAEGELTGSLPGGNGCDLPTMAVSDCSSAGQFTR